MSGTDAVLALTQNLSASITRSVLTPNLQGLEAALIAGVEEVAIFGAVSESFSQKNINCSITASLDRFEPVVQRALAAGVRVRGYVSCVIACPYEGAMPPEACLYVAQRMLAMGCEEISLGDTVGHGTPSSVSRLLDHLLTHIPAAQVACHFHDTYGMAIANVAAALDHGIRVFDSAAGGIGGCPYAKGASGNVATEDLVWLLEHSGYDHGVDLPALIKASNRVLSHLGRTSLSKVHRALLEAQAS